jgi:hypothetical protein
LVPSYPVLEAVAVAVAAESFRYLHHMLKQIMK